MKENQHAFENVVKSSYKVPYSLETHVLDATIPIGKKFVLSLHSILFGLSILSIDLLLKNIPFFKHGSKLGFIIFITTSPIFEDVARYTSFCPADFKRTTFSRPNLLKHSCI